MSIKLNPQDAAEAKPLLAKDDMVVEVEPLAKPSKTSPSSTLSFLGASSLLLKILYFSAMSGTMLVINKAAVHFLQAPVTVLFCQMASAAIVVKCLDTTGHLEADKLEWDKVKKFIWVVCAFVATLYCNMKVLQHANVETFITFRSSTPIVLSIMDYVFLGRALPSARSWACLLTLLLGSIGYVLVDNSFKLSAYYWLVAWYCWFVFDSVYIKHVCDTVKMTTWGRVLYSNGMAAVPFFFAIFALDEHTHLLQLSWLPEHWFPLILSCVVGIGMSHASYLLREATTATMFTMVGILCKILTVVINFMLWDQHTTPAGVACLLVCVLAGTFYQQAPKRDPPVVIQAAPV